MPPYVANGDRMIELTLTFAIAAVIALAVSGLWLAGRWLFCVLRGAYQP